MTTMITTMISMITTMTSMITTIIIFTNSEYAVGDMGMGGQAKGIVEETCLKRFRREL